MKAVLVEFGIGIQIESLISNSKEIEEIIDGVSKANQRIAKSLGINRNTLLITDGRIRAIGIAGIVQLTKKVELEIVPKFIKDSGDDSWKETLYLLSTMSKYGEILGSERVHADISYTKSLYDIASRILAYEYLLNKRKPIRKYRKNMFRDYSIEGDIDFSVVFERHPDGIRQSSVRFDRLNAYNATICKAMQIVRPFASDAQTKNILSVAISEFGKQGTPPKTKLPVPVRNHEWKQAYDLSYDIIVGLGTSYEAGKLISAGFVVDTWKLWEWLITVGIKTNNTYHNIIPQSQTLWGIKQCLGKQYKVNVFPDVEIRTKDKNDTATLLVDAKYKVLNNNWTGEIERNDLYEAFAFCNATQAKKLILVYPEEGNLSEIPGTVLLKSTYLISDIKIYAVQVSFGSINNKGGIFTFANNLQSGIEAIVNGKMNH